MWPDPRGKVVAEEWVNELLVAYCIVTLCILSNQCNKYNAEILSITPKEEPDPRSPLPYAREPQQLLSFPSKDLLDHLRSRLQRLQERPRRFRKTRVTRREVVTAVIYQYGTSASLHVCCVTGERCLQPTSRMPLYISMTHPAARSPANDWMIAWSWGSGMAV